MLRQSGGREVVVARGQDALLRLVVCADPRPRRAAWEWGSQQLEAGADQGRYKAEELAQASDVFWLLISLLKRRDLRITPHQTPARTEKCNLNSNRGSVELHVLGSHSTFQ